MYIVPSFNPPSPPSRPGMERISKEMLEGRNSPLSVIYNSEGGGLLRSNIIFIGLHLPGKHRQRVKPVGSAGEQQFSPQTHITLIKKKKIFLMYKEIQSGPVAKSYMRIGFLRYEEMRKYFPIYEEAVSRI
jgi:hypothetical protein